MDQHRSDADPDPNFHVDANMDPEWHLNLADLRVDPTPSFTHVGQLEFLKLLVTALPVYKCFIVLFGSKCVIISRIFDSIWKFSEKRLVYQLFPLFGIN